MEIILAGFDALVWMWNVRKRRIRGCLLDFCPEERTGYNGIYGDRKELEGERVWSQ